jgi:hypothetical protein
VKGRAVVVIGSVVWFELVNCSTDGRGTVVPLFGSLTVPVFSDDHSILADLGVSEFFREGEAQIPGTVFGSGLILPGSGWADNVEAGHGVVVWLTSKFYSMGCPDASPNLK